jgi:hypothetical protein
LKSRPLRRILQLPFVVTILRTSAVAAVLALASVGAANADSTTTVTIVPFESTIQCGTDTLTATGEIRVTGHTTTDAAGGLHDFFTANFLDASGTSTSGATYRLVGSDSNIVEFTPGATADIQLHEDVTWVGTANSPTYVSRIFVFLEVSPSGQSVFIDRVLGECRT